MSRTEDPRANKTRSKGNQDNKTKKRPNRRLTLVKGTFRLFFRTTFILLLLFFFTAAGLGLNEVLSCIKGAPDFDPRHFNQPLTSYIYDINNREVLKLHDGHNRVEVPLRQIPLHLQQAFISIEDERFYDHVGVSLKDIARAVYNNLRKQSLTDQGASTITQQLIKNAFLTPEKTLQRKIQEAWLAMEMERNYSKDEILEFYLNIIYFDQLAYGVEAAAQTYFGKSVSDLDLAESAMLAGIPRSPAFYNPRRNFSAAKQRQELVLDKMVEYGYISPRQASNAKRQEIVLSTPPKRTFKYPYFIDYVEVEARRILERLDIYDDPLTALNRGGLKIYTTLDPEIQKIVEEVVDNDEFYPVTLVDSQGKMQPQAAAVLAEPGTGYIKGLAGGRDYGLHNQDLRFLSRRQPGSAIKPVLAYAPAMEEGILFPGSALDDAPTDFGNYFPENYGMDFKGLVTAREALTWSYNVPAVQAYSLVTPTTGVSYARKLGISTFDRRDEGILSLTLGGFTYGVQPLEMAQVFGVFANKGVKVPLTSILRIEDHTGKEIYRHNPRPEVVLSEATSYMITDVLRDVARRGTAARLGQVGRPIAAKTGTTQDNADGWLVSYTPDYVLSAWIGYDLTTSGSIHNAPRYPVSMSIEIMKRVHEGLPQRDFEVPENITRVSICSKSGLRPSENCPEDTIVSDLFPRGSVPRQTCDVHVVLEVCSETGLLASESCPHVEKRPFLQRRRPFIPTDERWKGAAGRVPADAGQEPPEEMCEQHADPGRPLAPVGLSLTSNPLGNQVYLSWNHAEGTGTISGFNIFRKYAGEEDFRLIDQMVTGHNYIDRDVRPGQTYNYKVVALDEMGTESLPLTAEITTRDPEQETPDPGYPRDGNGSDYPDIYPGPPGISPGTPGEGDEREPGEGDDRGPGEGTPPSPDPPPGEPDPVSGEEPSPGAGGAPVSREPPSTGRTDSRGDSGSHNSPVGSTGQHDNNGGLP